MSVPACVGIMMDGNRRWARARGLPVATGHTVGYQKLKEVMRWVHEAGVTHVAAYAFSTENWQRPPEEVAALLTLFRSILDHDVEELAREGTRIRFVGDRARFDADMQERMRAAEERTADNRRATLHLLLSYGGRAEIAAAAQALVDEGVAEVTEGALRSRMWSADMPDPDIVIRTGGEKRLSNFLPWQSTYSELFFLDTLWPDFSKEEFDQVLAGFAARTRRHGR